MAFQFAIENPHIRADVIEIGEFPALMAALQVTSVPKVFFDGVHSHELLGGSQDLRSYERIFLRHVLKAAGALTGESEVQALPEQMPPLFGSELV